LGIMKKENSKKGVFFSTDAVIALAIILFVILIAFPLSKQVKQPTNLHYDVIQSLSTLKMQDIDPDDLSPYPAIIEKSKPGNTILEQIGEFYLIDQDSAKDLAELTLQDVKTNENIGLWYGDKLIWSQNATPYQDAKNIDVARQSISGIVNGTNITGFSARAFLSSGTKTKYFYFGGYVGDGNITAPIAFTGNATQIDLEIVINEDFDLYINNNLIDTYTKSPDQYTPISYTINDSTSLSYLHNNGETNLIEFKSPAQNLYIAGGFIKITYNSDAEYSVDERLYLPGIEGLINLYDGFYIPGDISNLNIFLHMNSSLFDTFLNIGNITVFNRTTNDLEEITITNSELQTYFGDYSTLEEKTTPLRLGMENVSYDIIITREADVFSVKDLSGSMEASCSGGWDVRVCCWSIEGGCGNPTNCNTCGGVWEDKLGLAKEANKNFTEVVLNYTGNRVGLIGYEDSIRQSAYHELSENHDSLFEKIDSWYSDGRTCICCGINDAKDKLVSDSSPEKYRSMVVMSDGEANERCSEQGTGNSKQDAINASCEAFNDHGIITHAVAFGEDADEATMQQIANCGNGTYYFSNTQNLSALYEQIAQDIISTIYQEQTIITEGGNPYTQLLPDSYIEFSYDAPSTPFGLIITAEKEFDSPGSTTFSIPEDAEVLEARATSYSGQLWTDYVNINSNRIYDIDSYNTYYTELGDPFSINFPISEILKEPNNNTVQLTVSTSEGESSQGSISDKIIYTITKNASRFSPILTSASGCIWTIEFENGGTQFITIKIPESYGGEEICTYTEANELSYNQNDAIQTATAYLLQELDLDNNYKIDVHFTQQDLEISLSEIIGIPFDWSTTVEARVWN